VTKPKRGPGRPPGSATRKTREIAERAAELGITPLEVMLQTMHHFWNFTDDEGRPARKWIEAAAMAEKAAPFIHPRLSNATVKGTGEDGALVVQVIRYAGGDEE
jgi:hypothetical protein